jgi:hypothetical protein
MKNCRVACGSSRRAARRRNASSGNGSKHAARKFSRLCERSLVSEPIGEQVVTPAPELIVLSEQEFSACVRQALRDYTRPDALAANPLLRSRLVAEAPGEGRPAARLQALLREALDTLKGSPRDEKFHRALLYTYFQPAATQENAAERLGLPFNTYRYHLARGGYRVAEWLWRLEVSGRAYVGGPATP